MVYYISCYPSFPSKFTSTLLKSKPDPASNLEDFMGFGPHRALYLLDLCFLTQLSISDLTFNSGNLEEFKGREGRYLELLQD